MNNKVILENEEEIIKRHDNLKKIALSFWKPFAFCSSYCIIYPLLQKYKRAILITIITSYFLTQTTAKYYSWLFNYKEYNRYRTFCMKYNVNSDIL